MTLEAFLSKNAAFTDDDVTAVALLHNHHPVLDQFSQVPTVEGSSSSVAEPFANGMLRWQVESQHPRYHQEEAVVEEEDGQLRWQRGREEQWRNQWTKPLFRSTDA
ncbi:hypothetical protein AHAS_Ahas20G0264300 [Arachis hypogaea]